VCGLNATRREAHLPACHIGTDVGELVIAHCAPRAADLNFNVAVVNIVTSSVSEADYCGGLLAPQDNLRFSTHKHKDKESHVSCSHDSAGAVSRLARHK
jgi:hypothetical protein